LRLTESRPRVRRGLSKGDSLTEILDRSVQVVTVESNEPAQLAGFGILRVELDGTVEQPQGFVVTVLAVHSISEQCLWVRGPRVELGCEPQIPLRGCVVASNVVNVPPDRACLRGVFRSRADPTELLQGSTWLPALSEGYGLVDAQFALVAAPHDCSVELGCGLVHRSETGEDGRSHGGQQ